MFKIQAAINLNNELMIVLLQQHIQKCVVNHLDMTIKSNFLIFQFLTDQFGYHLVNRIFYKYDPSFFFFLANGSITST